MAFGTVGHGMYARLRSIGDKCIHNTYVYRRDYVMLCLIACGPTCFRKS